MLHKQPLVKAGEACCQVARKSVTKKQCEEGTEARVSIEGSTQPTCQGWASEFVGSVASGASGSGSTFSAA